MSRRGGSSTSGGSRISWGAGGWIILLGLILVAAVTVWRVTSMLRPGPPAVGDGTDPGTYGFDLGNLTVPEDLVVGSGLPRDGIPVLDTPPLWSVARVDSLAGEGRAKYLVPQDRVIGVVLGGQARAYPVQILNWHEVVNDTLSGVPILVTYSPFCDAVAVWDRRPMSVLPADPDLAGGSGERAVVPLLFGHSGLLYDSDLLLYDRREATEPPSGDFRGEAAHDSTGTGHDASLWCQLTGAAVAGPAVGRRERLTALPCVLTHWVDWKRDHPRTTVLARNPAFEERYRRDPYVSYFGSDDLRFPVRPLPPKDARPWKTRCVLVGEPGSARIVPLPEIEAGGPEGAPAGVYDVISAGSAVRLRYLPGLVPAVEAHPAEAASSDPTAPAISPPLPPLRYAFWFAAYALEGNRGSERPAPEP